MKALKRKTATFIQNPKEKYIIDVQQYEIDKKQILKMKYVLSHFKKILKTYNRHKKII